MVMSGIGGDGKRDGRVKNGERGIDRLRLLDLENARACVVLGRLLESFGGHGKTGLG